MDISLMITVIAAFATPMILARFNIKLLPTSVAEIIVGIIIGKSCLNLVHIDSILTSMSTFGVILLRNLFVKVCLRPWDKWQSLNLSENP